MFIQIIILLVGLALILFGANFLVDGSSNIARKFGISEFIIGLTIVGIGTSTPEMVVSFISSFQGKADMAIGNVVGSNIFNTLLILGTTALISPLAITKSNIKRDIPMNIAVCVILILLGLKKTIFNIGSDSIGRIDGLFLLLLFAWYLYKTFKANEPVEEDDSPMRPMWLATLMIVGGLLGLVAGGRLFVSSASAIASMCGVSDKFIAITVMAGGTSMPELATCIVAAFKGKGQLALGNILGSNISNILLILGGASLIRPLSFSGMTPVDLGVLVISALFLVLSYVMFIKKSLDRTEGAILLLIEAGYMWYLIANL
ncbi:MAG: calcium/sodium antiporter [Bacteroidales bacterium]|nr:calcium/sodium antiporter [Bacteroidales bacterium]MDY5357078.1 calcium/sodium antiporter [Candidatus Cryptobacteroides sp.]